MVAVAQRPRPRVMSITEAAAARVREIVDMDADGGAVGVKVGLKKGGCAGMEYTIDKVYEPSGSDDVVEAYGAKVFVDKMAVMFLLGTEMDFETTTFRTGFVFTNPNQVSACGCGESVELAPIAAN